MNKAILIIDMPKSCSECPLFGDYYKDMICRANGNGINYPYPENFRQEWCPMRGISEDFMNMQGYNIGLPNILSK